MSHTLRTGPFATIHGCVVGSSGSSGSSGVGRRILLLGPVPTLRFLEESLLAALDLFLLDF